MLRAEQRSLSAAYCAAQRSALVSASLSTTVIMLDFAFGIAAVFFFLVFLAFFLVVTVPLNGTLVRLRANYNPKGLQLDEEDGVQPHTGPVVTSFFVMMARVKRLEVRLCIIALFIDINQLEHDFLIQGWSGLFKGMSECIYLTEACHETRRLFIVPQCPLYCQIQFSPFSVLCSSTLRHRIREITESTTRPRPVLSGLSYTAYSLCSYHCPQSSLPTGGSPSPELHLFVQ